MLMRHLHQQQSHASGRRVHQRRFAALQRIRVVRKIMRRHALQHRGRSLLVGHSRRNRHQPVRGHCRILGIRSQQPAPGHAIARLHRLNIGAHRRDHARALLPQHQRQRSLVAPFAKVHIDKVHARSGQLHHRFIRLGLGNRQLHQFHRLRPARLFDLNSFHGILDSRSCRMDSSGFPATCDSTCVRPNLIFDPAIAWWLSLIVEEEGLNHERHEVSRSASFVGLSFVYLCPSW